MVAQVRSCYSSPLNQSTASTPMREGDSLALGLGGAAARSAKTKHAFRPVLRSRALLKPEPMRESLYRRSART